MNLAMVRSMVECHFWANHVMLDALEPLSAEQFNREIPSSFPSIQRTVVHIFLSELFLLSNFLGEQQPRPTREQLGTLAGIRTAWADTEQRWRSVIDGLDEAGLEREVTVRFGDGQAFPLKAWQVIHQLMEHGPYHRGQVVTMLHQVGGKSFKTDPLQYHIARLSK